MSMLSRLCRLPLRRLLSASAARMEGGVNVEKKGPCAILRMCLGENRLNPNFVKAYNAALDKIENDEEVTCMVSIGEGKHYSLGLDLDHMASMHPGELLEFADNMQDLFARMITFPIPSVAAINGHIYAAGTFIALTQDYSVMRTDRGWFCLPEVNIKRHFSAGVLEIVKARLPVSEHHVAIALGKRYTAVEAKAAGIVNEVSSLEELEEKAIAAARKIAGEEGLDRKVFSTIKQDLYRDLLRILREPSRFYSNL